jgi:hypothetical protein
MKKSIFIYLGLLFIIPFQVIAQNNLENNIRLILSDPLKGEGYLKGYSQHLSTAFGISMGGSLFHRAYAKTFPRFDAGLSYSFLKIPEEAKTFNWSGEEFPTVFGSNSEPLQMVPGTGLSQLAIPQLQLNLGLFADFEVMVRGWSPIVNAEIGKITLYGAGIKYGLSDLVFSPIFAIDLSVQVSYHILTVSDWLEAGTFGMNIQVSKEFSPLPIGFYASVGYEATSMTIKTDMIPNIGSDGVGDVKLNGDNGPRINLGTSFTFHFLVFHVDYNIAKFNSLAGGVKIGF